MAEHNSHPKKSFNPWHFIWIAVVISELFTAFVSTLQHHVLYAHMDLLYMLKVGAVDALFVPLLVAPIIIYFLRSEAALKKINTQLAYEIAERKRVDEGLRESEEKFSLFMDYLPSVAFIKDAEGRTLYVNKFMKESLGGLDWTGKTTLELFPKAIAEPMIADDKKALAAGYTMNIEAVPHVDGTEHVYQTQKFVIMRVNKAPLLGGLSFDITKRERAEHERESLIADLQKAVAEIKTLHGILPICSVCKRIRDEKGAWKQMEMYIHEHLEAEFSHGYCPDCYKKAMGDLDTMKKNKP